MSWGFVVFGGYLENSLFLFKKCDGNFSQSVTEIVGVIIYCSTTCFQNCNFSARKQALLLDSCFCIVVKTLGCIVLNGAFLLPFPAPFRNSRKKPRRVHL